MKKLITYLKNSFKEFNWRSNRSINSFKTAIACLIGFFLGKYSGIAQAQWIVVAVLMVMTTQSTLGGLLIKSYMRILGTFLGALIATIILQLFGANTAYISITLFITILGFSYIAGSNQDISLAGTMGAVTVAILLLTPNAQVSAAILRFFEILSGLLLALAVFRFILPVHARILLRNSIAQTLCNLQKYYQNSKDKITDYEIEAQITSLIPQQDKLIHELKMEPGRHRLNAVLYQQILNTERRIFSGIRLIGYCTNLLPSKDKTILQTDSLKKLNDKINDYLLCLSNFDKNNITEKKQLEQLCELLDMVAICEQNFKQILSCEDYEHLINNSAFIFLLRYLTQELQNLTSLLHRLNTLWRK